VRIWQQEVMSVAFHQTAQNSAGIIFQFGIRDPKFKCVVLGVVRIRGRVSSGDAAWAELPDGP
jgi:hypothetical protein